jgi:hypothetical protein
MLTNIIGDYSRKHGKIQKCTILNTNEEDKTAENEKGRLRASHGLKINVKQGSKL